MSLLHTFVVPTKERLCHSDTGGTLSFRHRRNLVVPTKEGPYLHNIVHTTIKLISMYIFKQHHYYVYIITNPQQTVLYTGVTNDLERRLTEHWGNRGRHNSFAGKYHCYHLLYYEEFTYILNAIAREKEIKGWRREKKTALINTMNPGWAVLNEQVCRAWPPSSV